MTNNKIINFLNGFKKPDTFLALFISFILQYIYSKDLYISFIFSILFVVIFLFFLNFLEI